MQEVEQSDLAKERLESTVRDVRGLHPRFEDLISRISETISQLETSTEKNLLKYSEVYLNRIVFRSALIRLRLILENNLVFIETLGLLAATRYIFEVLVWLRLLSRDPRYAIVFLAQVIDKQIQHMEGHKKKIESEIILFEKLENEQTQQIQQVMQRERHDDSDTSEEISKNITATIQNLTVAIDRRARRAFSLYADQAKHNGYGCQAYLLREKGLRQVERQIDEFKAERDALRVACSKDILRLIKRRWSWRDQAERVGMRDQYEFLYAYTSRLLHATPVSIWTDQKNLEIQEMYVLLEYVYVSMLDVLDLSQKQC